MKTAVYLSDPLFHAAEKVAKQLGISRSALYSRALSALVAREGAEVTGALDRMYCAGPRSIAPRLERMQSASLHVDIVRRTNFRGKPARRGEIWLTALTRTTKPGYQLPVLVVQSDAFNQSWIPTVIAAAISLELDLAEAPGNTLLPADSTGLAKDSVALASQLITIERRFLTKRVGALPAAALREVDLGLRLALSQGA
jgi:mRNA interferase MazF